MNFKKLNYRYFGRLFRGDACALFFIFIHLHDKPKGMKKIYISLLTILTLALTACGGDDGLGGKQESPVVDQDDDQTTETVDDNYTYQLPVIFHVLYADDKDPLQYVPANRLKTILDHVNELYAGSVYGQSQPIRTRFVLASHDERGNALATPGVDYVHYTADYPISPEEFMSDNTGNNVKYIWDPNEYINVMVYNFKQADGAKGITLGISHLPYSLKNDHPLDGLTTVETPDLQKSNLKFAYCSSINSLYINYESDRYNNSDHQIHNARLYQLASDINITVAHELGHYLGLLHVFSETAGNDYDEPANECADTDFCEDTPSYNRVAYLDNLSAYLDTLPEGKAVSGERIFGRSNCEGSDFTSTNLMDYFYSEGYAFSKDQRGRMRNVLYYSPLMPGPKLFRTRATRATAPDGPTDLPIRMARCIVPHRR